jgi:hypothetical protein
LLYAVLTELLDALLYSMQLSKNFVFSYRFSDFSDQRQREMIPGAPSNVKRFSKVFRKSILVGFLNRLILLGCQPFSHYPARCFRFKTRQNLR